MSKPTDKPIVKPSWLNALNNKEQPLTPTAEVLQEPAKMEVGEDESVAALPKYDTPPALDLTPPKQAIGRGTRDITDKPPITPLEATVNSTFGKFGSPKKDLPPNYDGDGPGEEDGPRASGWAKRIGAENKDKVELNKAFGKLGPESKLYDKPVTEPTSSTKLPFPFDTEAFDRNTSQESILDDSYKLDNVVNRIDKPAFFVKGNFSLTGEFIPDLAEQVTQTGQQVLGELIEQLPEEYKESLLNSRTDSFQQEFTHGSPELDADAAKLDAMFGEGSSGPTMPNEGVLFFDDKGSNPSVAEVCKECNGTGSIWKSLRHGESDYEEWEDDCPECDGDGVQKIGKGNTERYPYYGSFDINQIDNMFNSGMPLNFGKCPEAVPPGTYTAQLNDKLELVNVMPFMPNNEALLPEPKVGLEGREILSSESWLGLMTPTESIAFDNHIELVMQSNSLHAAHLIRLKGFKSKYLQAILTTPEMAEEHIRVAIVRGEDPGGWDNSDHRRIKQAQELIARGFEVKAKAEARQRHRLYIQQTRDAWKKAVEDRKSALELLNIDVANKKETFQLARDMTFNEYMARFESGD